ncbi:hypothetical protein [Ferruginibacter sp.]|uniref:hypothetical protein n=1 Tax=Ferruginibacter sp. TaxID=1940288 RepID=UPI00374DC9E1
MKKIALFSFCVVSFLFLHAQDDTIWQYKKTSAMMPMRDGVKLYTVIISPAASKIPLPVLIQ